MEDWELCTEEAGLKQDNETPNGTTTLTIRMLNAHGFCFFKNKIVIYGTIPNIRICT